jgi:hypothetical protein
MAACGGRDGRTESPEAAVRAFVDAMDRSSWDPEARREAFELLSEPSRALLRRRAERTTALAGRPFDPMEIIARGRFRLRVAPTERNLVETRVEGDRATVVLRDARGQTAEVPLVRERDGWALALVSAADEAATP